MLIGQNSLRRLEVDIGNYGMEYCFRTVKAFRIFTKKR